MGIIEDTIKKLLQPKPAPVPPPPVVNQTQVSVKIQPVAPPKPFEPIWLIHARADLGLKEGVGAANNPRVLEMFAKAGHPEVHQDSTAWCAAAVGCWLEEVGIKSTGTLWALDYRNWGSPLPTPVLGAIAVKQRLDAAGHVAGHVGLVAGYDNQFIWLLAGNQGDMVRIAAYQRRTAGFAFRWPANVAVPNYVPASVASAGAKAGSEA